MDPLDFQLQDVIVDLGRGLERVAGSGALSPVERDRADDLATMLGRMRFAIAQAEPAPAEAELPSDVAFRIDEIRARMRAVLERYHDAGAGLGAIGDSIDDTIRVMSVVGKWPPRT